MSEFTNDENDVFILLKGKGTDLIRIWIGKNGKAYKVEIRKGQCAAYMNPDEFVERLNIK